MDKVKLVLSKVLEQAFWLSTVVVLVTAAVGWFLATGKLAAGYTTERRAIEGKFTDLQKIADNRSPPNQDWPQAVKIQTDTVKTKVKQTWSEIYNMQKDQVLKWPADLLGEAFVRDVEQAGPNAEIGEVHRRTYQNLIAGEFPRLVQLVGAASPEKLAAANVGGAKSARDDEELGGGSQTTNVPRETIVLWDAANQSQIEQALHWPIAPPTTLEVRNTQENLWVLRTLLAAIAQTNGQATGNYNATVKRIDQIAIGPDAANKFVEGLSASRIKLPEAPTSSAPGGADTGDGLGGGPKSLAPPGGGGPDDKSQAVGEEGRYLDATGKPIATAQAKSEEFKRLPVYLRLWMDQRQVTALIGQLANAPLPVELRQFRLNPSTGSGTGGGGVGGGTAGHSPRPSGSSAGFGPGKASGGDRGPQRPAASDSDGAGPFDSAVELHGIVYIYNPPDKAKLATAADAASEAAAPAGDAAAPSEP